MGPELKGYIHILLKRSWLIIGILALCCGVAASYSLYYSKPLYESSTKIIVNSTNRGEGSYVADYNQVTYSLLLLDTYKEIVETPAIMGKVASQHPELNKSVNELISEVKVASTEKSQVLSLIVRDHSSDHSVSIANAVADVFKQEIPQIMSVDNVTILSQASINDTKLVSKGLPYYLAIAIVIGILISFSIAFLWEYLDDSIRTEHDIGRFLEQPALAAIAQIGKREFRRQQKRYRRQLPGETVSAGAKQPF